MQKIRKITSHIVFKIFIAVAVLVFVLMGFSDYFINRYEPFIAKVGDNKITQRIFLKELERARNAILARDNSKQAVEYVDSKPFKAQILENQFTGLLLKINSNEVWSKLIGSFNAYNLLAIYGTAIELGMDSLEALQ